MREGRLNRKNIDGANSLERQTCLNVIVRGRCEAFDQKEAMFFKGSTVRDRQEELQG